MQKQVNQLYLYFSPNQNINLRWLMPMLQVNSTMKLDYIECAIGISLLVAIFDNSIKTNLNYNIL